MRATAIIRKLEKIEGELRTIREALAHEPAEAEPVEPEVPVVDHLHRKLVFKGRSVGLTAGQTRLAELLLAHLGQECSLEMIDVACRPSTAPWTRGDSALRQLVFRLKSRLQDAGLADLAEGIRAGYHRAYLWAPVWQSQDVTDSCVPCHSLRGTLSGECKPKPKGT